ncbi:uncharacterized protein LOC130728001 isoform X2 [Lotus japonicus]|nr:uncharacterized protein LOC130728001 isoform X2 [Lotus japonicus]
MLSNMNRKKSQPSYLSGSGTFPFTPNSSVSSRNLNKNQLGGVIFGCKSCTYHECLNKNLFGLPAGHFSYVRNIEPGLPLFLFNYTDRKLHGIFLAASRGKMMMDPYAWSSSNGGSDLSKTQFPAQVQIRVQRKCDPLSEDTFRPVIEDNYYTNAHFWFELDHVQVQKLICLMTPLSTISHGIPAAAPAPAPPPQNKKWTTLFQPSPPHGPSSESEQFEMHDSGLEHHSDHSIARSDSTENDFALNGYIQPLDTHTGENEVKQDEKSLICIKLKELALNRESQNLSLPNDLNDSPDADANNIYSMGKNLDTQVGLEKEEDPSSPFEYSYNLDHVVHNVLDTPVGLEKKEGPSSPFEYPCNIAQHLQLIQELIEFKNKQAETNYYVEQKLIEAQLEIQTLKDRCAILESACNIPPTHVEKTAISSYAEMELGPKDSLFLLGGYDGESWLASMDLYCTSQNVIQSLKPMSSIRSYASAVQFNGEIFVFGGGDGYVWYDTVESYNPVHDNWTLRPSLNQKKGSLSGASLNNRIFAVGGGNGVDCFSDVEMFDLDIGRWIPTRSMLDKRFALAAAELNGALYATGGYDGNDYLKSAERFDPREHSWAKLPNMNTKRGCHSLVVLNENL